MPTFTDPEREDPLSSLLCRKRCVSTGSGASFPPLQRGYWSHPLPLGHNGDGLFQETRLLLAGAQDTIPRPGTHAVAPSGASCQKPSGPANEQTLPGLLFVERVKSELRFFWSEEDKHSAPSVYVVKSTPHTTAGEVVPSTCWPSVCLFWRNAYLFLLPVF